MGHRNIGYLEQIWYTAKYMVTSWIDWQRAKKLVGAYRPGWVELAEKCENEETRQYYRLKVLNEYRGVRGDGNL